MLDGAVVNAQGGLGGQNFWISYVTMCTYLIKIYFFFRNKQETVLLSSDRATDPDH